MDEKELKEEIKEFQAMTPEDKKINNIPPEFDPRDFKTIHLPGNQSARDFIARNAVAREQQQEQMQDVEKQRNQKQSTMPNTNS